MLVVRPLPRDWHPESPIAGDGAGCLLDELRAEVGAAWCICLDGDEHGQLTRGSYTPPPAVATVISGSTSKSGEPTAEPARLS